MMRLEIGVLSAAEQETIHQAALTLLDRTGLRIKSPRLLGRLLHRGVPGDATAKTVYLPPSVVAEALAAAPRVWQRTDQCGRPLPDPSELVSRLVRGIQVDTDTLALEAIERIGHTGDWLTDAHTLNWLRRNEHAFGTLFVRAEMARQAGANALEQAHQKVEQILAHDRPSPVPFDAVQRIDDYVTQEKRAIQTRPG
ncbi:MAG: trimethylamine methyltransferase family protein [Chloroflexi bacterium]|nr:trimethylamine methyltransferase family protein [Chloroflexota bacterium]